MLTNECREYSTKTITTTNKIIKLSREVFFNLKKKKKKLMSNIIYRNFKQFLKVKLDYKF